MDPLTITGSVLAITARCLTTVLALHGLRARFQHAQTTISALCSESTIMSASLAQIQNLILSNPDALTSHLQQRPELVSTFDTVLTGCMVVFSVLDDEVQRLFPSNANENAGLLDRARVVWKEDIMNDLLSQIRGQQGALTLLVQALQL
jgi:hypothetical protein